VLSFNENTDEFEYKLLDAISPAEINSYVKIEMENGVITKVSPGHEFYTKRGLIKAKDLLDSDEILSL
jgi:intein/homing endonuclease